MTNQLEDASLIVVFTGSAWFQCAGGQVVFFKRSAQPISGLPAELHVGVSWIPPLQVPVPGILDNYPMLHIYFPRVRDLDSVPYVLMPRYWDLMRRDMAKGELYVATHRMDLIKFLARVCERDEVPFTLVRVDQRQVDGTYSYTGVTYSGPELLFALDYNWDVYGVNSLVMPSITPTEHPEEGW